MAFDAFEVMRNRVSKVSFPVPAVEAHADVTPETAVVLMDRFLCLIIASGYQKKSGQPVTHLHEPANKQVIVDAKRAASLISQWEKKGIVAKRTFSIHTWQECVAFISISIKRNMESRRSCAVVEDFGDFGAPRSTLGEAVVPLGI